MPPHNLESFRNAIDFSNRFQNGIWKLELLSSLSTQSDILQLFNSTFWVGILDDKGTNMVATANRPEKSCVCCSSLAGFSKISTSNFGCYIARCFHFVANLPSCTVSSTVAFLAYGLELVPPILILTVQEDSGRSDGRLTCILTLRSSSWCLDVPGARWCEEAVNCACLRGGPASWAIACTTASTEHAGWIIDGSQSFADCLFGEALNDRSLLLFKFFYV